MTFISLTQAGRCLDIDAKTLRRWLSTAALPLLSHPHDARQKGISHAHLHQLAEQHHRQLMPLSHEPSRPPAADMPSLSEALGEMTAQLEGLHEQVTTLQQQVSVLTALLTPVAVPSAPPVPAPPARLPRPRPKKASPPSRRVRVIAWVEYDGDGGYVVTCPKRGRLHLQMESPEWFAWLASIESFRFVGQRGHFTAHHAWQVPNGAWRAHRHIRNRSYTLRLAPTAQLTRAVLEEAAATLQAHLN